MQVGGRGPVDQADVVRIVARAHERDRYLAALLSPANTRADLIALAAFAGEVGRIALYVREPMMGRIRLQWWRERLESGTSGGHPVAAAVIAAASRRDLPAARLTGLIAAHEDGLDDRPFADEAALLAHVDRIDGALFELAAKICGIATPSGFILDAGRAYGLARIGFETPAALAHGRLLLPGLAAGLAEPPWLQQIVPAIVAVSTSARQYLLACSAALGQLSRGSRSPFLPLALVEPYLHALELATSRPAAAMEIAPLQCAWRLLRCRWTGKVD